MDIQPGGDVQPAHTAGPRSILDVFAELDLSALRPPTSKLNSMDNEKSPLVLPGQLLTFNTSYRHYAMHIN